MYKIKSVRPISDGARMVFIVGASRSGTTMLSRSLGRHSDIRGFPELHFFEELWDPSEGEYISEQEAVRLIDHLLWTERQGYFSHWERGTYADEAKLIVSEVEETYLSNESISVLRLFQIFLCRVTVESGKCIPCEQTPRNMFYLDKILGSYAGCRIIYMVRDPRDVLLSQKNRWQRRLHGGTHRRRDMIRDWVNYHPLVTPRLWLASNRSYRRWMGSDRILCVHYESLVTDPSDELGRICQFIGVPFERAMVNVPHMGSSSKDDESGVAGMDRSRIGGWKNGGISKSEIYLCERILCGEMEGQGYASSNEKFSLGVIYWYCILPFRMALAVLFNFGRARNFWRLALRRFWKGASNPNEVVS